MLRLKLFEEFDLSGTSTNYGRGLEFTKKQQEEYQSLKKNSDVYWGVYDIDKKTFIDQSPNFTEIVNGASVPKAISSAAALNNNGGDFENSSDMNNLKKLLIVSDNSKWSPIEKLAGGGKKINSWSKQMGWSNMTPAVNNPKGDTPRGINVEGMCLFWSDTLNNNYKGSDVIKNVSNSCKTSYRRSRVYLPKDCKVGTKTGTWNNSTKELHDSGWIITNNGKRFAITVLTKLFNEEKVAIMWGGLFREYCQKYELPKKWQPKSGVVFAPVEGKGNLTPGSKLNLFGQYNFPWRGLPENMRRNPSKLNYLILQPNKNYEFEDLLDFVEDGNLDYLRPNTIIIVLWGDVNIKSVTDDVETIKKYFGFKQNITPIDQDEKDKIKGLLIKYNQPLF